MVLFFPVQFGGNWIEGFLLNRREHIILISCLDFKTHFYIF